MTESEWWAATDPSGLVEWLLERRVAERKGRLFSLACCRKIEKHFPKWPAASVLAVLEAYADDQADSATIPKHIDSG